MSATETPAIASALQLVAGLRDAGMAAAVVSPGSRNAPLIQAFATLGIRTVVALDERSAAHHALGLALTLKQPVAVCCTSGTAALNHGPGLAEAHRSGLPLISLTADRPAGADGEWQSQTLAQDGVHTPHVRASFTWDAPLQADGQTLLEGMTAALSCGPIHVNCPFEEPLYAAASASAGDPAPTHPAEPGQWNGDQSEVPLWFSARMEQAARQGERVLLLGGTHPWSLPTPALKIWGTFAALVGDTTSGLCAPGMTTLTACDRWLSAVNASGRPWADFAPDLVVSFGAPLLSRRLRGALAQTAPEHLHIDPGGSAPAAFSATARNVSCSVQAALETGARAFTDTSPARSNSEGQPWHTSWWDFECTVRERHPSALQPAPWSDLIAHQLLHAALPKGWGLHLGNSTPVRYAQLFERRGDRHPWSNRGVAGIDGCNATAVGAALAGQPTTLITGELGFLYDANAFHIHPQPDNLRIAVIHNGGGGIFRWLEGPERTGLAESHFEWQHHTELRPLCDLHGLIHERVTNAKGLKAALEDWWEPSVAGKVLEIVTPGPESAEVYKRYMAAVQA
ncbi:MAG: 2-succinyl-5-enolpyruvyl-6-hydroxy-3-cyclohexene-1-carboxylic-acid synthase [Flavobacteriales bacterium]|nr:2-succinyl-5-enolpyruvyl-6-hydroxy-3-cyclohexene-1-carboxylic-acid synthase [Flavobacteriales bacterium]